jgi:hypothetical protein
LFLDPIYKLVDTVPWENNLMPYQTMILIVLLLLLYTFFYYLVWRQRQAVIPG